MRFRLTYRRVLGGLAALLFVFIFFLLGFVSSRHARTAAVPSEVRKAYLTQPGDATPAERAGVLVALRGFQDGYVKRDPKDLDAFMNRLFLKDDDVLLQGTDSGEWVRGYSAVGEFIRADWTGWGDFRFAVDDSIVWCTGDVAWIASVGTLRQHGSERPLRFSAVLTRHGNDWRFRQVHFQWDDSGPDSTNLRSPHTYVTLFKWALQSVWSAAQISSGGLQRDQASR